jgi:hypothetical protein
VSAVAVALAWVGQTLDQVLPDDELAGFVFLCLYVAVSLMLGRLILEAIARRIRR